MFLQLDENYFEHPKTRGIRQELGPEADVYPIRLWMFCFKFAKTGVLKGPQYVELACGWEGEKGKLLEALKKYSFLEPDGCTIHDWEHSTGGFIMKYEKKKEEQKAIYALRKKARAEEYQKIVSELPQAYKEVLVAEPSNGDKGGGVASRPSPATPGTTEYNLFRLALKVVQGVPTTVRTYLEKWISAKGPAEVERILMDPKTKGQSVMAIQKYYFDSLGEKQTGGFLG